MCRPLLPYVQASFDTYAYLRDSDPAALLHQSLQRSKATADGGDMSRIWDFAVLLRRRSNVILYAQGIFGCMPWGVIGMCVCVCGGGGGGGVTLPTPLVPWSDH